MDLTEKICNWLLNGETGSSSEHMARIAMGHGTRRCMDYPCDPSDFKRCLKLVDEIPEIKDHFPRIAASMPEWKVLIDHWEELKAMFLEEIKPHGLDGLWCAKKTYQRMQELYDTVLAT